jgi:hypothetical protein
MGTPADFTLIVLVVALGVGVWTLFDRLTQMQRDIDALKRKLGANDPPAGEG